MAISTTCPNCQALFSLPDELAGRKLKCQKCAHVFQAPKADEAPPPVVTAAPVDEEGAPKKSGVSAGPPKTVGDAPTVKNRRDEDDDRPRKRRDRQEAKAGSSAGMIILILVLLGGGLLGCLGCGVVGLWLLMPVGPRGGDIVLAERDFQPPRPRFDVAKKDFDKDFWINEKDKDGPIFDRPVQDRLFFDKEKDFRDAFDGKKKDFKDDKDGDGKKDFKDDKNGKDGGGKKKLPPPIQVVFGPDGVFRSSTDLNLSDPAPAVGEPLNFRLQKRYTALLEANVTYQIDMVAERRGINEPLVDCYLYVVEGINRVVARDDDGGGFPNARIVFKPNMTMPYRIVATSSSGRDTGPFTLTIRRMSGATKTVLPPPPETTIGDLTSRVINFPKGTQLAGDMIWNADGKSFFALDHFGTLWRLDADTDTIDKTHDLKVNCVGMAMSSKGLLVGVLDTKEVWIIDPNNLEVVKAKIAVPKLARISAPLVGKYAVASAAGDLGGEGMFTLDLEKAEVAQRYLNEFGRHAVASPDGKYVFAQNADEELVRYRFEDGILTLEETSYRIAQNSQRICISSDGKYVCLPSSGGNYTRLGHPDHPPTAGPYTTYIYQSDNLKKPVCAVTSGAYPRAVGFDVKNGLILAQDFDTNLRIYNFTGAFRREAKFAASADGIAEFSVAPQGSEFLIRSNGDIVHVKLHSIKAPVGKGDPPKDVKPLIKEITKFGSFARTELNLTTLPNATSHNNPACWDAAGRNLYCLEEGKNVYRINPVDWKVEATNKLPSPSQNIGMSAQGVVVMPTPGAEIWVLDPATLAVRKKIKESASFFAVAPTSPNLVSWSDKFQILDFRADARFKVSIVNAPPTFQGVQTMTQSPDGKYLCVQAADFSLHRLRLSGDKLVHEASKPATTKMIADIEISPDGKKVAFLYAGAPTKKAGGITEIFAMEDWDRPIASIAVRLRRMAMDGNGGLYGESTTGFVRYYPDPVKAPKDYRTGKFPPPSIPQRLLAPPQGPGCLVLHLDAVRFRASWIDASK